MKTKLIDTPAFQHILTDLSHKLRWQDTNYFFPVDFCESITDHLLACWKEAKRLLRLYPISLDKTVLHHIIFIHDLDEYFTGDVSLFTQHTFSQKQQQILRIKQKKTLKVLVSQHNLHPDILQYYAAFDNWTSTTQYKHEAAFARLIDGWQGAQTYFQYSTNQQQKVQRSQSLGRVVEPLHRLQALYQDSSSHYATVTRLTTYIKHTMIGWLPDSVHQSIRDAFENRIML